MAENVSDHGQTRHLDASGEREVVFCHQCEHEWWQDEHGLICPRCESEITEIVSTDSDPRPNIAPPAPPPDIQGLRDHNPWAGAGAGDDSDPEEADIEEHVTQGPNGVMFTRTIRTSTPLFPGARRRRDNNTRDPTRGPEDPDNVMRNFQDMIGTLMGPQLRQGLPGRSGPDTLFNGPPQFTSGFRMGGNGGPTIMGGRVTFTSSSSSSSGRLRPRDLDGQQPQGPPVDDLQAILGSLFGPPPGQHAHDGPNIGGLPPGLQGLFAAMLNPANARSGDAVYSQEALDQIISTLMEQHPTSNAPGPASPDAIAALPKKNLTEKELGPEGKGECSVCMDDVTIGTEVIALPCSHWFHETCASMWLGEHNTCPICRKGIDVAESSGSASPNNRPASQTPPASRGEYRARRLSLNTYRTRPNRENESSSVNPASARNEARLDAIRNTAGLSPTSPAGNVDDAGGYRWGPRPSPPRVPHESRPTPDTEDYAGPMPGAFFRRPSDMSPHERDRDRRSGSRRSSGSGGSGSGNGNGGVSGWIRDRFGSNGRRE